MVPPSARLGWIEFAAAANRRISSETALRSDYSQARKRKRRRAAQAHPCGTATHRATPKAVLMRAFVGIADACVGSMQSHDSSSRVGLAPAWSVLALQRARHGGSLPRWNRLERTAAAAIVPLSIWLGCVLLASTTIWSWLTALVVAPLGIGGIVMLRRSALGRRWRARVTSDRREWAASELRGALMARMTTPQRIELQSLEELVEHLRAQPIAMACPQQVAGARIIARLDSLVCMYADLAIELEGTLGAFATTADDLPGFVEAGTSLELHERSATYVRITELRVQAREQCRRRIGRLRADLHGIGQVVRLVHEQALAAGLSRDEVARQLNDILDEAELVREVGEEVDALTMSVPARNGFASLQQPNARAVLSAAS